MPTWQRIIWLLALTAFTTGCTAYRRAALPPPSGNADIGVADPVEVVRPGMTVRVLLRTGEELTGEVLRVSPEALVFGKPSNYGWQERTIPAADILSLEVQQASTLGKVLAWTVGTTMLVAAAGLIALAIAFSGSDLGGLS